MIEKAKREKDKNKNTHKEMEKKEGKYTNVEEMRHAAVDTGHNTLRCY